MTWKTIIAIILTITIVGGSVYTIFTPAGHQNLANLMASINQGQTGPIGTQNSGINPNTQQNTGLGEPFPVRGTVAYGNGTAHSIATVTLYVPDSSGLLYNRGEIITDVNGVFTSTKTVEEGAKFYILVNNNSTSVIRDQWFECTQGQKTDNSQDYIRIEDTLIIKCAPPASTDLSVKLLLEDGTSCSTTEGSPTPLSIAGTTYIDADQKANLMLFVNYDDCAFGGEWIQPKTDRQHVARTYNSVVEIGVSALTGWSLDNAAADGWKKVEGQTTTKNYTRVVPEVESKTSWESITIPVHLNFNQATAGTTYSLCVYWVDSQMPTVVEDGDWMSRVAPNEGYLYKSLTIFYFTTFA